MAETTRTDRISFDAIRHTDGRVFQVFVTNLKQARVARRGYGAILELAHTVTAVLKKPVKIFEGIRWAEDEDPSGVDDWLCYCARQPLYYDPNFTQTDCRPLPSAPDDTFLVFVNKDLVAYHWIWDKLDEDGSECPRGYHTRFIRQVFP